MTSIQGNTVIDILAGRVKIIMFTNFYVCTCIYMNTV